MEFFDAWDHFLFAADNLTASQLYRYDLIDVSRQSLQLISNVFYAQLVSAYQKKDMDSFKAGSISLLELLRDMDTLLGTDTHFLLGHWLEDAKAWGTNDAEKVLYEYNARNQLTLWGPSGNIVDYASKQWAGLMSGYYYPRWKLFVEELLEQWNSTFDQNKFNEDVFNQAEQPFTFARNAYPNITTGDQIDVARLLHAKYRPATYENTFFFKHLHNVTKSVQSVHRSWNRAFSGSMTNNYILQ